MYRNRTVEHLLRDRDKTIARLERQVEELLNRLMFVTGTTWTPPPLEPEDFEKPEEHEDPDFPGYVSSPELTGV